MFSVFFVDMKTRKPTMASVFMIVVIFCIDGKNIDNILKYDIVYLL